MRQQGSLLGLITCMSWTITGLGNNIITPYYFQVKDKTQLERTHPEASGDYPSKPVLKPTFSLKSVVGMINIARLFIS